MTVSLLRLRYILTYLLTAWRETTDLTMTIFHENVNSKSAYTGECYNIVNM